MHASTPLPVVYQRGGETVTLGQLGTCLHRASSIDLHAPTPAAFDPRPPATGASPRARASGNGRRGMASSYYGAQRAAKLAIIPGVVPAMVLAAGLGTRLRPLTDHRAKALVPVGDRPALAHVVNRLRAAGISRVVVNAHHHLDQLRAFASGEAGLHPALSEETDLLGTAGCIAHAKAVPGEGDV